MTLLFQCDDCKTTHPTADTAGKCERDCKAEKEEALREYHHSKRHWDPAMAYARAHSSTCLDCDDHEKARDI